MFTDSVVVENRVQGFEKTWKENDKNYKIVVYVRYDDRCKNGHNTFSITGDIFENGLWFSGGCLHKDVVENFPEFEHLIKWHLCSSDGPLHYIENSMYWAGKRGWCHGAKDDPPNLRHFRNTAVWPEATQEDMENVTEDILNERLPKLMNEFRECVEDFGFTF